MQQSRGQGDDISQKTEFRDDMGRIVNINGVEIHLRNSDDISLINICSRGSDEGDMWVGRKEIYRYLTAAWIKTGPQERSMTPVLVGEPGNGKTYLAIVVASSFKRPVNVLNCTSDMRPEDLIITPVIASNHQIIYRASPLVAAMITGGTCILDEASRMNEKCWASLASLLDDRGYVESTIAGVKIQAHPEFRFVATMNHDPSTYTLPQYIESRLKPIITVKRPKNQEIIDIVSRQVPYAGEELINSIVEFLARREGNEGVEFSLRDALEITQYASRLEKMGMDYAEYLHQEYETISP